LFEVDNFFSSSSLLKKETETVKNLRSTTKILLKFHEKNENQVSVIQHFYFKLNNIPPKKIHHHHSPPPQHKKGVRFSLTYVILSKL
jgi:hypothetical protein